MSANAELNLERAVAAASSKGEYVRTTAKRLGLSIDRLVRIRKRLGLSKVHMFPAEEREEARHVKRCGVCGLSEPHECLYAHAHASAVRRAAE